MEPRKLNVLIATYPYAGNGGISSQADEVSDWLTDTMIKASRDPRIGRVTKQKFSDTPITMTRNASVCFAREIGADVLVMVDSDMWPDKRLKEGAADAKPFFETSFDFLYQHYDRGPVVIGAPYCGPPPCENVYVFQWTNRESRHPGSEGRLSGYTREQAFQMAGIQHCAALPTGLIMFDMRAFELTTPAAKRAGLLDRLMAPVDARLNAGVSPTSLWMREFAQQCLDAKEQADESWFYYEWTDRFRQQKASTEDVTATRDMSLCGVAVLGYNPIMCNWDAWAGHWKVKCVDKPDCLTVDDVNEKYARACIEGHRRSQRYVELGMQ
jgi:hypothetical protein